MRSKCPYCETGCDKPNCVNGYLEVGFAEGDLFTRECLNHVNCGFCNGGRISNGFPPETSGPNVIRNGPTQWVLAEDTADETGYERNAHKFAARRLQEILDGLRIKYESLRQFAVTLANESKAPLTREQAVMLHVCRICRGPDRPSKELGSLRMDFGKEHAHQKCLEISRPDS